MLLVQCTVGMHSASLCFVKSKSHMTLPRSVAQRAAWPAGSLWSQGAGGTGWSESSPSAPPCTSPARERETEGEGVVGHTLIHHLREGELLI